MVDLSGVVAGSWMTLVVVPIYARHAARSRDERMARQFYGTAAGEVNVVEA